MKDRVVYLYPPYVRHRRMAEGKKFTLPDQCMSLAEMFRRFVRREPLPVEKQGVYIESDYDLEKVANMDRLEQEEVLSEMREKTQAAEAKVKSAQRKKKKEEIDASAKVASPSVEQKDPKEGDSSKNPPPKGA